MNALFLKLLNMSIAASWLVIAVIVLRFFLKKTPSWISCLMWGIVALRLVMPFSIESAFSLIPSAEVIPLDVAASGTPAIHSGIPVVNSVINPMVTQNFAEKAGSLDMLIHYAALVWLAGVALMLVYSAVTYIKLYHQVSMSIPCGDNVYLCDEVESPFLLGIFSPRIYLPSDLPEEQKHFVLDHENAHIKRRDYLWKPLGFLLLTLYWFNPLMWVAYILLCRDIERACDEKVIAGMDPSGKIGYSQALVACSVHRRMVVACPVAFGEVSVKSRIKGVLNYKKPVFWVVCVSMLVCLVTAACFLTNPQICIHAYEDTITTAPTCTETGLQTRVCSHCQYSYTMLVDRLDHSYDSGVVTEPATCTHQGTMQLTCVSCGDHQTQPIEKTAHTASELVFVQEPNCTHEGTCSATCTQCDVMFVTEVLPVNHDHDLHEVVVQEPTCEKPGQGAYRCSRCDYSEEIVYEQLPHNYMVESSSLPTCISTGYKTMICVDCNYSHTEHLGYGDHSWQNAGNGYNVCSACGWRYKTEQQDVSIKTVTVPETTLPAIRWDPGPVTQWGTLSW